jgi:HSP20 family protein
MSNDFDWMRNLGALMRHMADESMRGMSENWIWTGNEPIWTPQVDVYETCEAVVVKVCAAGVQPDRIDISLSADGRSLYIKGIRDEDPEAREQALRYHQLEIYTGPFERTVALPTEVVYDRDNLSAVARDGYFCIRLPKRAAEDNQARSVPISASGERE